MVSRETAMRLNVCIPKDKEHLLAALAEEADRTGRSTNELVLEAIEQRVAPKQSPRYRTFPLSAGRIDRGNLYPDRPP
jgi:hypothetical protein